LTRVVEERDQSLVPRGDAGGPALVTVGHGTMSREGFAELLRDAGVEQVVDVRSFPGSRHNPQFAREQIESWLPTDGVTYRWESRLGGFRRPRADSANVALRNSSFRGYADHMATAEFREALDALIGLAGDRVTTVMCAETLWWRCHRRLIADAAVLVHSLETVHLGHDGRLTAHRLTEGVRLGDDGLVVYDGYDGAVHGH
jgi:uncharacterized protein (DUF488 family)